jgi:hypothetical protein
MTRSLYALVTDERIRDQILRREHVQGSIDVSVENCTEQDTKIDKLWLCYRDSRNHAGRLIARANVLKVQREDDVLRVTYTIERVY